VVTLRRDTAALGVPGTPTVRCVAAGVEIRWSPAVGASSYEVQRALGSTQDFVSRADVSTTTWTDDQTVAGKRFEYRVVARHQLTASGASAPASIICSER